MDVVKSKSEVAPRGLRRRTGIKTADQVEFRALGSVTNLVPELPRADDEYTPEQRRVIDAQLAASKDDLKKGRVHGPFETHDAMIAFLHDQVKSVR